jgi:hypothetical protein
VAATAQEGGDAEENPSPLERLVAERVVATSLEVQTFESLYRQNERKLTRTQTEYQPCVLTI